MAVQPAGVGARCGANARQVFRAYRFRPDFPGLQRKSRVAGKPLEESVR